MAAPWLFGIALVNLQLMLAELQAARYKLLLGQKEATVSYEGKSVTFTASEIGRIDAALKDVIDAINELNGMTRARGPVYAAF
jgi:hypothetical protein